MTIPLVRTNLTLMCSFNISSVELSTEKFDNLGVMIYARNLRRNIYHTILNKIGQLIFKFPNFCRGSRLLVFGVGFGNVLVRMNRLLNFRSSLGSPCCILEQNTFTSQKVLVIPRKRWLRPDMTEILLTGT